MSTIKKEDIDSLTISERIELVEDIWDSIIDNPDNIELENEQREMLDERLDSFRYNSTSGSSWQDVKERIMNG